MKRLNKIELKNYRALYGNHKINLTPKCKTLDDLRGKSF